MTEILVTSAPDPQSTSNWIGRFTSDKSIVRLLTVVAGVIGVLHLYAGLFPSALNWGFHYLAFLPPVFRVGVPILILVSLIPSVQHTILLGIELGVSLFQRLPRIARFGIATVGMAGFVLLTWFGREGTCFLGDGWLALRNLNAIRDVSDIPVGFKNAPLPAFIMWKLALLLADWNIEPHHQLAIQIVSIGCGLASVIVLAQLGKLIAGETIDRILVFLFIIAAGGSQLYFGYVESYTPTYFMVFVFLWLSLKYLASSMHLVFPAMAFSILVACHFGMVFLSPVVVFLFFHAFRKCRLMPLLVALVAMTGTFALLLCVSGYTPASLKTVLGESGSHLVPPTTPSGVWNSYTLFSRWHLVDLMNILLIHSPFALPALVVVGARVRSRISSKEPHLLLVLLAALCGLGFAVFMNFDIGMSRDWDLLSPFILATIVAASFVCINGMETESIRRHLMVMMVAVTLMHTTTWISVNANVDASIARFEVLPDPRVWGSAARAYAYEELAVFFRNTEHYAEASTYIRKLLEIDSTNGRRWTSAALVFRFAGEKEMEIRAYEKAVQYGTSEAEAYGTLGIEYANTGRLDEAAALLEKALEINPELPLAAYTLGTLFGSKWHRYKEALYYLAMAVNTDSTHAAAWLNTGTCYYTMGLYQEMIPYYQKYLELAPDSPNAQDIRKLLERYR